MGALISSIWSFFQYEKPYRILVVGMDGAGKTTLLYRLRLGEIVETFPTVGFNVENVTFRNVTFTMWDMGMGCKGRILCRQHLQHCNGIIHVVDSKDRERIQASKDELYELLAYPEYEGCPVLLLANKQDMKKVASPSEIETFFEMKKLSCPWAVYGISAIQEKGIEEAFDWFQEALKKYRQETS